MNEQYKWNKRFSPARLEDVDGNIVFFEVLGEGGGVEMFDWQLAGMLNEAYRKGAEDFRRQANTASGQRDGASA